MVSYFIRTPYDEEFYNTYIKDRLPDKIVDMHLHITTDEICRNTKPDMTDWAAQCGSVMTINDYEAYSKVFYPGKKLYINALPSVTKGVDADMGNEYIASLKRSGRARFGCMLTDPSWSAEYTERVLLEGNFDGYKPYPDFIAGKKSVDIGMFDFINRGQFEVLNKLKKAMVLHLPRAGRFPDDKNIKELTTIKEKYPDIKLIIAHCGRSYAINVIKEAHRKLGSMLNEFYYDIAAVLNPAVLRYMLENVSHDRIMYGTDLPVFLWHGRRRWTDDAYFNLAREDFAWNTHYDGKETEAGYTFFLYEQLKNVLDAADEFGGRLTAEKLFYDNAVNYLER